MALDINSIRSSVEDSAENGISSLKQLAYEKKMEAKKKADELKRQAEDAKKKAKDAKDKAKKLKAALKGFKIPSLPDVPKFKMKDLTVPAETKKLLESKAVTDLKKMVGDVQDARGQILSGIATTKSMSNNIKSLKSRFGDKLKILVDGYKKEFSNAAKSLESIAAETTNPQMLIGNIAPEATTNAITSVYDKLFKGTGKKINLSSLSEITYTPTYPTLTIDSVFTAVDVVTTGGNGGSTGSGGSSGGSTGSGGSSGGLAGGGGPSNSGGGAEGGYIIHVQDTPEDRIQEVYNVYKSMVQNSFNGTPAYKLAWPSNTIVYGDRRGKVEIKVTTELYDSNGRLLLRSSGWSVNEGPPEFWWNNHRADFIIPAGEYKVIIRNEESRGDASLAFILAQGWYQKPDSPMQYMTRQRITPGQSAEFTFNTAVIEPAANGTNNLIKINNTNILE